VTVSCCAQNLKMASIICAPCRMLPCNLPGPCGKKKGKNSGVMASTTLTLTDAQIAAIRAGGSAIGVGGVNVTDDDAAEKVESAAQKAMRERAEKMKAAASGFCSSCVNPCGKSNRIGTTGPYTNPNKIVKEKDSGCCCLGCSDMTNLLDPIEAKNTLNKFNQWSLNRRNRDVYKGGNAPKPWNAPNICLGSRLMAGCVAIPCKVHVKPWCLYCSCCCPCDCCACDCCPCDCRCCACSCCSCNCCACCTGCCSGCGSLTTIGCQCPCACVPEPLRCCHCTIGKFPQVCGVVVAACCCGVWEEIRYSDYENAYTVGDVGTEYGAESTVREQMQFWPTCCAVPSCGCCAAAPATSGGSGMCDAIPCCSDSYFGEGKNTDYISARMDGSRP